MLDVNNLSVHYDGIAAVNSVSFRVDERETVVLIGANGAGKSSLLRAVFGLIPSEAQKLDIGGIDFWQRSPRDRVAAGLSLVPETRDLFPRMTVEDNLKLGLFLKKAERAFPSELSRICDLFPVLAKRLKQIAGTLSGGEQQMLALGRALLQGPRLLCLDEPSLGLAPKLVDDVYAMLAKVRDTGVSILLVEQQARRALDFGVRGYVLNVGRIVAAGTCAELKEDEYVKGAYLGEMPS
ncbi:MAG: ABC transporter ATP-binding protein [Deltaproteobacteria bacterium]|nr:ABC transporter ATP-binding protein [Deltaproteobacteria bacterium]